MALDVSYVERASLVLDLDILLRTLPVALLGLDAYGRGEVEKKTAMWELGR